MSYSDFLEQEVDTSSKPEETPEETPKATTDVPTTPPSFEGGSYAGIIIPLLCVISGLLIASLTPVGEGIKDGFSGFARNLGGNK